MKFMSIRLKVLLLVIAMVVPIVLLGIAGTLYYQSILKQNIQGDELAMAKTISVMTPEYMNTSQLYLKSIADRPLVIKAMEDNDTAFLHSMAVYVDETNRINNAYFTDSKGNVIASTQNISSMIGSNVVDNLYVGDVLRTGDSTIGDAVPGYEKMPVVPIGVPIKDDNGTTLGVLVGTVDLDVYSKMIRETAVNDQQIVYLVNRTGHIMIHNDPQYVEEMVNFSSVPTVQNILRGETGVADYYNPVENQSRLGAYAPIEPMGWGVVVGLPTSIAYQPAWNAGYLFVGGTALLALGAILLGLFLANGITSPILRLSLATKKISDNSDFVGLIPLGRNDEIGDLAHAFKGMVDDIQDKQEELESQTEELEVQNEEIRENNAELQKQIQERMRAEEAHSQLASIVEASGDAIISKTLGGIITSWNNGAEQLYGYSSDEVIGKSISILTPREHPDEIPRILEKIRLGAGISYDTQRVKKDGTYVYVSLTVSPLKDRTGSIIGAATIARDITERKQAEQKLAYVASFPELNTSPIIEIDDTGTIKYTNPAADRLFPDLRSSSRGHKMLNGIGPEMIKKDQISLITRDVFVNGAYYQQTILYMPDSRTFRIYATDITERIKAEESLRDSKERFRALADNIPNLAWMADAKGWIFWYNKQWYDYTGTTLEEMQGWGWQKVHHPDYVDAVTKEWSDSIAAGKPYDNIFPLKGKDGNYRWFLTRIKPIRDEKGNIVRWFGTNTDITDRKQMEEDLKVANTQAELYLDLMGHDISNMHQIIMGQLELAQEILETDCKLDAVDKTLIDTSLETLDRSARLIDNVRNLQKLSHGEFREEVIDLDGLLSNVIREFDAVVPDESIKLESNGLHYVKANKLLHDVFTNLMGNAIKHSNKNNIDISIKLDSVNENGKDYHRVSIEDKGPGISDDMKEKVFNRLQRGKTEARGVGLGLYLVKTLVESFSGFVKVEDRVQGDYTKGAKFLVYLPIIGGELSDE